MKVGIIGCGNISEIYFKCQNIYNNFEIVACADINLEAAKNKNLKVDIEVPTDDSPSMAVGIENYINK